jgi:BCCT family betaine/carnitine transporter
MHGFKGIGLLAKLCIYLFFGLLIVVLVIGGEGRFIIENGVQSLGKMLQHFIELCTFTDPGRTNGFPQEWTIYYWAYWMVWCVAAPFFIGKISKGRTIKQTILGGYLFGIGSTISSFVILGNYGLGLQTNGTEDFVEQYSQTGDVYGVIIHIIESIPVSTLVFAIIILCMILFYATSFDSIAYTAVCYSYKKLGENERPNSLLTLLWCILLITLPVALVFSESSMSNIQSVSIISAFPIGIIFLVIICSLFKDAREYLNEKG